MLRPLPLDKVRDRAEYDCDFEMFAPLLLFEWFVWSVFMLFPDVFVVVVVRVVFVVVVVLPRDCVGGVRTVDGE